MDFKHIEEEESPQALRLCRWIMRNINPKSVVDFGCATGFYLKPFPVNIGCLGIEFDDEALVIAKKRYPPIQVMKEDLSKKLILGARFDLGICLEVAEHMTPEGSEMLAKNIARNCRTVIFSAAAVGQGGDGHINCRDKREWVKMLRDAGMYYDEADTASLIGYMRQGYHLGWFINNAFVATGVH